MGECARRYALAHLVWLEARYCELGVEYDRLTAEMGGLRTRWKAVNKQQRDCCANKLNDAATQAAQMGDIAQGLPLLKSETRTVETAWYRCGLDRGAQTSRARSLYGVRDLTNHTDWNRSAHAFGENWRRWAEATLHGGLGRSGPSWAGPAHWQLGAI